MVPPARSSLLFLFCGDLSAFACNNSILRGLVVGEQKAHTYDMCCYRSLSGTAVILQSTPQRETISRMTMPISELRQKKWAMLFGLLFLHQAAAYLIVRFCIPYLAFGAAYIPYLNSGAKDWTQLLFAHMLSFSLFPAFAIALLINRTLRHRSAVYVWVVPMVIFAYEFLFSSPTVYPTMVFESDFGSAFR